MNTVRLGIIGLGNIGKVHAGAVVDGKITRCELTAVCSTDPSRLALFPAARPFNSPAELIRSDTVDAVLIATPHYSHVPIGIAALRQGLHVLVEKPIAVHKAAAEKLIAAHTNPRQVFAAMFNQRPDPFHQKIRAMIRGGELGKIRRINWITTHWFRTAAYYASGSWRATWAGEGGGVLLNQSPHQLDLLQWFLGMPVKVRAFCSFGRYHNIEVEDDVTAYLEFPNGATGIFITSTGEHPGTNRLELTGERGKLVFEDGQLTFLRNDTPMTKFSRAAKPMFNGPVVEKIAICPVGQAVGHVAIIQNFVDAILDGTPLIARAEEGIHSVELANAMLFSSLKNKTVELPLDGRAYARLLRSLIKNSRRKKIVHPQYADDLTLHFR